MESKKHHQVRLSVNGTKISVDRGVQSLVSLMNSIEGIETYNSCQGGVGVKGYVQLGGGNVLIFISLLAGELYNEQAIWKRKHNHDCNGCAPMSVSLSIDGHWGTCIRWHPYDYKRVMAIVRKAITAAKHRGLITR